MDSFTIKQKFIQFYLSKNHKQIPSVPLIAENDPTLLFVNSGMFPLVPYLLGEKHPQWTRLVNYQRCFRSNDIDEVGDQRHTTCFEMLWNWSLGDYFKEEQLNWWFEFLIEVLWLDIKRIYQTVYWWSKDAPEDTESIQILQKIYKKYWVDAQVGPATKWKWELWPWKEIDFTKYKIFPYTDKNWWQRWDAIWEVGWPDTETFYDTWKPHNTKYWPYCHPNCDCGRFIEIGNSVFIQYVLTENWWKKLDKKNVDFGWGLERLTMVVNNKDNVFQTDAFKPYIKILEEKSWKKYKDNPKPFEIIADHIRAVVFLIMDWWLPSNKDQWYFIRRLIRRILVQLHKLDVEFETINTIAQKVIEKIWSESYPQAIDNKEHILSVISKEQKAFAKTLKRWIKYFEKIIQWKDKISWYDAFVLQATYWFPFELIEEMASEKWLTVNKKEFLVEVEKHKQISRAGAEKKFKSWLADSSAQTTAYHTITHLLHQTLRNILWNHVQQKWSNITADRLRFDFSHPEKLTDEQKQAVEETINEYIKNWFVVKMEEMDYKDAIASGAIGLFKDKYSWKVKVYTIYSKKDNKVLSKELCSWPHLTDEKPIKWKTFKIKKEQSAGAGIRRIKAVLE